MSSKIALFIGAYKNLKQNIPRFQNSSNIQSNSRRNREKMNTSIHLTHIYMTAHYPGFVPTLQYNVAMNSKNWY